MFSNYFIFNKSLKKKETYFSIVSMLVVMVRKTAAGLRGREGWVVTIDIN